MIRKHRWLWIPLLILPFACSEEVEGDSEPIPDPSIPYVTPNGDENYLSLKSDYIFDQSRLHTFELNLSPENLARIDRDPSAEEYVEGSLTFEGETMSPVGIRYKGSIGAFVGCVSGSDWTEPSGHKTCTKLSMKVKMNWLDNDDKFYDLKKLQFHSQNLDNSQMRDRLGYHLFREMGVPAPRSTHARIFINGVYTGVYALVEQIDGRFTRQNFDDGSGNLYKEVWPLDHRGRAQSDQVYLHALRTNEEDDPSPCLIKTFATQVQNAREGDLQEVITKWMDVDEIISYAVVDRMIRVDDGPFHWYCSGTCSNHNYYWYENPKDSTLHLIPWDLDNAFENIASDKNPVTPIADDWGEISADCNPFRYGLFGLKQRSAACDKLTSGWVQFQDEYEQKKREFIEGPFKESTVNALLDQWFLQIREATREADEQIPDAVSMSAWEASFNELKSNLNIARNN